jgi:predicted ATPase
MRAAGACPAPVTVRDVHDQLDRILRSPGFANAPFLSAFLQHVVDNALSGHSPAAKEYTIAVEVFGRPETFDPRTDTIVRVQARRLRARLDAYYKTVGHADPVVIEMPRGTYAARFQAAPPFLPPDDQCMPWSARCTSLIGRQEETAALVTLLTSGRHRLVTVTGPGGTGKTRLAQHVAAIVRDRFAGGVFFTSLATVTHADEVASSTARALGLSLMGASAPADALIAQAPKHVRQPSLLVLDNFEHLVAVAPLLVRVLDAVEPLALLVTSRSVLRVTGEHEFSLPPLPLPDTQRATSARELSRNPAVALFVQRAAAANPRFALSSDNARQVAEICCRVDGLPLALELAAARIGVLSPDELLKRLDKRLELLTLGARDLPDRQQTLRATIDWSHQLLNEGERRVFRRLAVFAGTATVESVEAVCNARLDLQLDVLNAMTSLVDKHLVRRVECADEQRFGMLETIREFALEQLSGDAEAAVTWRAHAAYCLVVAEEGAAAATPVEREHWLSRCDAEHENFCSALDRLISQNDISWALRIAAALYPFWDEREYLAEGKARLEAIRCLTNPFTAARATASKYAAALATAQGDLQAALVLHHEALEIYERLGDERSMTGQLISVGVQEYLAGHHARAQPWFERALETCRRLASPREIAGALANLANVLRAQGDYGRAEGMLREAFTIFEGLGDGSSASSTLNQLGDVARDRGDIAGARRLYKQSIAHCGTSHDPWRLARSALDLGSLACEAGTYGTAHRHLARALKLFIDLQYQKGVANTLDELSYLAMRSLKYTRSLVLAGVATELRAALRATGRPASQLKLRRIVAEARERLSPETAASAWRAGRSLSIEQVSRFAADVDADSIPTGSSRDR